MSIVRKNLEIQLEILFRFYDGHFNNQKYNERNLLQELKGKYTFEELMPHLVFLIDGKFIEGQNTTTRAGTIPSTSRISYKGIQVVQSIIDEAVPKLEELRSSNFKNAGEQEQFSLVKEVWNNKDEIAKPFKEHLVDSLKEHFMGDSGSVTTM